VRDPVVLSATLPRFLLTGDRSTMNLDLDNVEGAAGAYSLTVTAEGPVAIGDGATKSVQLRAKQRDRVVVPLNASGAGSATVKVAIKGPGDFALERSYVMNVKPATQVLARRTVKPIAKGESLTGLNLSATTHTAGTAPTAAGPPGRTSKRPPFCWSGSLGSAWPLQRAGAPP
jgi:hypothetical protein